MKGKLRCTGADRQIELNELIKTIAPGINYNGTFTFSVPEGINQVPLMKIGPFEFRNIAFSN